MWINRITGLGFLDEMDVFVLIEEIKVRSLRIFQLFLLNSTLTHAWRLPLTAVIETVMITI